MISELMGILDDQELGQLETEMQDPLMRYDMGGAAPIVNPIAAATPQAGGHELPSNNGALARLVAQQRQKQGIRPKPGLKDNTDQFESGYNWHETGGV
jgi:hypothetical protein